MKHGTRQGCNASLPGYLRIEVDPFERERHLCIFVLFVGAGSKPAQKIPDTDLADLEPALTFTIIKFRQ